MKVLHICPYMHPSAGGPPIVVERLCEEMAELGWGASLITTSQFCQDDGRQLQTDLRSRIDARVLPLDRPRLLGSASGARPMIEDQIAQADIVHIHTLWHPFNGMARMACARTRTPYVTMPHGMLDPYSLGVKPFRKKLYLKLTEQATLRQASRIVFTTPLEEQLARASAPWLGASEVVPLGADPPPGGSREALAEKFVTEFPDASGRRCLLFLGRLHPKKGIEHLIQILPAVLSEHPDSVLVIAGTGDESYVRRLKAQVAGTQLTSHVLFAGLVLDELKWGALAAAEIFLLPSYQENFAVAVAEAMHMALPVIVSDKVNTWPFIQNASAGIVVPQCAMPDGLQRAVLRLMANRNLARVMGERGRSFARAAFTWPQAALGMTACYDRVLSEQALK